MGRNELEDAIKLSEDCCAEKDLLPYYVTMDWHYGGSEIFLVCAKCRTQYRWVRDEKEAWKLGVKVNDQDLYEDVEHNPLFMYNVRKEQPKAFDRFVKKLSLDKDKLEKILDNCGYK